MGLEWAEPGIILRADPFGEGDALAAIFTEGQGVFRGLARGGFSKARANIWQVGNLVEARWVARLADQLGSFTAELVHPAAALAMQEPLTLATLLAACAVAEGALPEREAHERIFRGLLHLIVHVANDDALAELVQWESGLLTELGYGLDLSACAVTGSSDTLAFVSPRTGRAVCEEAAGLWRERLFRLPPFLTGRQPATRQDIADGFRITGHFLARDVFGLRNLNLPPARIMLYERVLAGAER